ncbi:MAG: hypothetical protein LBI03_01785 [Clostridiales bacterium]|nr:hypothetical protein [Clostridiales bacterium]
MKARLISSIIAIFITLSFAGCSSGGGNNATTSPTPETTESAKTVSTPEEEFSTPLTPAALVLEGEIFDGAKSSKENPVPFGEWASTTMYNAVSDQDEPCFVRITRIVRDSSEVEARIDAYNEIWGDAIKLEIEPQYKDLFEFVIVEYEIAYPAEWPTKDGVIHSSLNLSFTAENNEDIVGFVAADGNRYFGGYSSTTDMIRALDTYPTPGTILKCVGALQMVKGYDNFCLRLSVQNVVFAIK